MMDLVWVLCRVASKGESGVSARLRSDCRDGRVQRRVFARLAGRDGLDLEGMLTDAVEGVSGCGTPVAFSEFPLGGVVLDVGSGRGIDRLLAVRKVGRRVRPLTSIGTMR